MFLLPAIALATPVALTAPQQQDIACVAILATTAEKQRLGAPLPDNMPNAIELQQSGKIWAGMVGSRITEASGQPRELIAVAMTEAAKAEFQRPSDAATVGKCAVQMRTEIANAQALDAPLPKPVTSK